VAVRSFFVLLFRRILSRGKTAPQGVSGFQGQNGLDTWFFIDRFCELSVSFFWFLILFLVEPPRAVKRAGKCAPSTPGRLGYLAVFG
jgi:hypothetical protein